MTIPVLETERLILRPLESDDLDALSVLHAEETFWWFPLRRGLTRDETAGFIARHQAAYRLDGVGLHVVMEKESSALAGWAGLSVPRFLPEVLPAVEVGWRLGEHFRGKGYATEAGGAAVAWGFSTLGLREIISIYEPENRASGRVMEHLGFEPRLETTHPEFAVPLIVMALDVARFEADRETS